MSDRNSSPPRSAISVHGSEDANSLAASDDRTLSVNDDNAQAQVPLPGAQADTPRDDSLIGHQLEGREILVYWEDDRRWYDATVVRYYPDSDKYYFVYKSDKTIEIARLRDLRWVIAPKKRKTQSPLILNGAIIEFIYPYDGLPHRAMIFDYTDTGDFVNVAYLNEHATDTLGGEGWDFITTSPCILDDTV